MEHESETSYIEVEEHSYCLYANTKEAFKNILILGQNKKQI